MIYFDVRVSVTKKRHFMRYEFVLHDVNFQVVSVVLS